MSTSRLLLTFGLLAAVSAFVAAPASAHKKSNKCAVAGSSTIDQTKQVRVYEIEKGQNFTMYGCRKSNGKKMKLDNGGDDGFGEKDEYGVVQIARYQVAWVSTLTDTSCRANCPPDYDATSVRVATHNLLTGASRSVPAEPIGDAVSVSINGGLAWAAAGASPGIVDIHVSNEAEEDQVIDSGAIDPKSLDIEKTIISWARDGVEHFARLR